MSWLSQLDPTSPHSFMGQYVTPFAPAVLHGQAPDWLKKMGDKIGDAFSPNGGPAEDPALTAFRQRALGIMDSPNYVAPSMYAGQTYAGFTPTQMQGQQNMLGAAGDVRTMLSQFQGNMGQMLGNAGQVNPMLGALTQEQLGRAERGFGTMTGNAMADWRSQIMPQIQAAQDLPRQAAQNFMEQVAPELRASSQFAGQLGGSRQGLATGIAAGRMGEELTRQMGNIAQTADLGAGSLGRNFATQAGNLGLNMADIAAGNTAREWGNAQDRGMQAYNMAFNAYPTMANMAMLPGEIYSNVGAQEQAMNQAGIDEAMKRHDFAYNAQFLPYERMAGIMSGMPQPPQQMATNPLMSALGGAAAGFSMGGPWGALGGGLLGYMGGRG